MTCRSGRERNVHFCTGHEITPDVGLLTRKRKFVLPATLWVCLSNEEAGSRMFALRKAPKRSCDSVGVLPWKNTN